MKDPFLSLPSKLFFHVLQKSDEKSKNAEQIERKRGGGENRGKFESEEKMTSIGTSLETFLALEMREEDIITYHIDHTTVQDNRHNTSKEKNTHLSLL